MAATGRRHAARRDRPPTLDSATRAVVAELHEDRDEIVAAMLARLEEQMAEFQFSAHPELMDPVRRSCVAHITGALAVVTGDRDVPASLPPETLAETRVALWQGISLAALSQNYRVCHSVLWERYMVTAHRLDFPPEVAMGVLRHGWRCLFSYNDGVVVLVSDEYERERQRSLHAGDERRAGYVREILRGGWVAPQDLGYDLELRHVAVIASGGDAGASLRRLSRSLGCALLTTQVDDLHLWAWFGSTTGDLGPRLEEMCRTHAAEPTRLALGSALEGSEGFRESKRQAELAERVAQRTGALVTSYADVALEALVLADESAARRFMVRELGVLADDSRRSETLRQTLLTYLEASQNAASAAATLGVHDRTVGYRLRSIAEVVGSPIARRATELGAALRIRRVLGKP